MNGRFILLTATTFVVAVLFACGSDHPFDRGKAGAGGLLPSSPISSGNEVSFALEVKPELQRCTSCHAGGAGSWTYDAGAQAHAQVLSQLDLDNPANSPLLRKGANEDSHGGGEQFSAISDAYQAILSWIEEGATDDGG